MTDIEQTARNFTAVGLRWMIKTDEDQLTLLDSLDAEYGDVGREARQKGREFHQERLERIRAALALKGEA